MGTPTVTDLKSTIRMNLIKNSKVTTGDVNLAEKAFGPDVGSTKGKTTRTKPTPVTINIVCMTHFGYFRFFSLTPCTT